MPSRDIPGVRHTRNLAPFHAFLVFHSIIQSLISIDRTYVGSLQPPMVDLETQLLSGSAHEGGPVHTALLIVKRWLYSMQIHFAQPLDCVCFHSVDMCFPDN
jgi:hypothetical protein